MPSEVIDQIERNGFTWIHRRSETKEFYDLVDERGWYWQVFQHLEGPWKDSGWTAVLVRPGNLEAFPQTLNCRVYRNDDTVEIDALDHLRADGPFALMDGIIALIRLGVLPQTRIVPVSELRNPYPSDQDHYKKVVRN